MRIAVAVSLGAMVSVLFLTPAFAARKSRFRTGTEVRSTVPKSVGKDYNVVKEDGKNVVYKKKNVVDFDDALIEGEIKNPNEFYFVHRPEEKFGNLVKKRQNFHKEMLRDSVMIR